MARGWMRASGFPRLVLAMAVLAGCGVGEGESPGARAGEELEPDSAPERWESGGETDWVRTVRSAWDTDAPVAVGHDRQGNVITLGNHRTLIDFGQGSPEGTPSGASVLAVTKYSPDGERLWSRLLEAPPRPGTSPFVRGQALAVEPKGAILLLGMHSGGLDLGGGALPPGAFLARLDANGQPRWARPLPVLATELAVDQHGELTLSGVLTGEVDFGNGPVKGNGNPYLVRYDAEGGLRWVRVDSARGVPMDLAYDDAGDLYLVGGRFIPPSPLLTPFLSRVSPEGHFQWTIQLQGASGMLMGVAAHGDHVVVSGSFTGSFVFGDRTLVAPTSRGFVLAFSRDMGELWGFLLGSTWGLVAMDEGSGVVIAGRYAWGEDFGLGLGPLSGFPGSTNLYVLRLKRPTGEPHWIRTFPSASSLPVDLSVSHHGESALLGSFRAPVNIDTGQITPVPGGNTFLLQLER